jgi:hypothetical protein
MENVSITGLLEEHVGGGWSVKVDSCSRDIKDIIHAMVNWVPVTELKEFVNFRNRRATVVGSIPKGGGLFRSRSISAPVIENRLETTVRRHNPNGLGFKERA